MRVVIRSDDLLEAPNRSVGSRSDAVHDIQSTRSSDAAPVSVTFVHGLYSTLR